MNPKDRTDTIDWDLLSLYLSDHISGATAGVARMSHMAKQYKSTPHGVALHRIAGELREERAFYLDLVKRLGLPRRRYRQGIAWLAERVGRLKLNGRLLKTSPMTPVLESELMRGAIIAKLGGWRVLRDYHEELGLEAGTLDTFIEQAERQVGDLDKMHAWAGKDAFRAKKPAG